MKVKGQKDWMWVWQSQSASFIAYEQSRGYVSIIKNFPNGFKSSTLVSDALSAPRDELLKLFNHLLELNPEDVDKLEAFHKRMRGLKFDVFNFLFYAEVPPDNNSSERAIRNVKVKQKISGQFRSTQGATRFAVMRSVIDTVIKRGGDPLTTLRFAVGTTAEKRSFLENKPELKSFFILR